VTAYLSPIKTAFAAALMLAAGSVSAFADAPTPAALDAARVIIVASGLARSFDVVVPQAFGELERSVVTTRPELKDSLHATLMAIEPEFVKGEMTLIDNAAMVLAKHMTEQELKDTAAFFQSASGKKYVESQPASFGEIMSLAQAWSGRLSTEVLTRAREEMKKKGLDF
jgi:hypothetical protein